MIVGVHVSIAEGLAPLPFFLDSLGCNAMQLFLHSPQQWRESTYDEEDIHDFKKGVKAHGIKTIVGHSSYFTNFAKPWKEAAPAMHFIKFDLDILQRIGGHGLVTHVGKFLELPKEDAFRYTIENLNCALEESEALEVPLFLENGAGQGTEIGVSFEELARVYEGIGKKNRSRLFFCLDTCHSFAAGYDWRTLKAVLDTFKEFDRLLGAEKLKVIHLNDAKKPLGSHVDRHADLGQGEIGWEGIQAILSEANRRKVPLILETPDLYEDVVKITKK
ncbi:deoxyribonuclease IV [Candidatus Peregrinibacteria bacterium]|nr:deoxyribonuclease IV [Candidatus Peregrinibacteria bacterium]